MSKGAYLWSLPAITVYFGLMLTYEDWHGLEERVAKYLYGNEVIKAFYYFGETPIVLRVALVVSIFFIIRKQFYTALLVLISISGSFGLNHLMKAIIKRPRPPMEAQLESYSFPSGHAMASFSLLFLLAYILTRILKRQSAITIVWLTTVLLIIGTGLSRVASGDHYITDVVAGWGLAYTWLTTVFFLFEKCRHKIQ